MSRRNRNGLDSTEGLESLSADEPWVEVIRFRHKRTLLTWTPDRMLRLAKRLKCTPRELLAHCGIYDTSRVGRLVRGTEPIKPEIALHLWKIERHVSGLRERSDLDELLAEEMCRHGGPESDGVGGVDERCAEAAVHG
jgi:hypothetical protein